MIRSVYILENTGNIVFTKEYADSSTNQTQVEFLINLTTFLNTIDLEDKIEFMNLSVSRFFYAVQEEFTFVFIADKADDASQIEDKIAELMTTFMGDYVQLARAHQPLDGFQEKVDEIAVTMVKVAILGFAGVGKTTTLHLL
ncbi:MAG: hypothetical protein ACTSQZ_04165, partial [Candidatus Thorarchaeota archaeon]